MHPSPNPKTTENAFFSGVITLTEIAICRASALARISASCRLNSSAFRTSVAEPLSWGQFHPTLQGYVGFIPTYGCDPVRRTTITLASGQGRTIRGLLREHKAGALPT